jgi:hypothetical protein
LVVSGAINIVGAPVSSGNALIDNGPGSLPTFGPMSVGVSGGIASSNLDVVVFSNSNGVSFGLNGSTLTASVAAQTSVSFANSNGVSFGLNAGTLTASVATAGGGIALSAGTQSASTGSMVFANSNGVTFGMSLSSQITASYTVPAAQTGLSGLQVSNTTYSSGTVTFQNANGVSFGSSGANGISASYTVPSTAGLISAISVSAGTTSGSLGSIVFSNSNGISFGLNGSTVTGSVATSLTNINVSAGTTSNNLSAITFSNSNGVSFGLNGSTLTGSIVLQSNQSEGNYALGNTFGQSSSSSMDARSQSVSALGALSVGFSASAMVLSAPATSSLVGTNGISVSSAGSTISVLLTTANNLFAPYDDAVIAPQQVGNGSFLLDPQPFPNLQFDRVLLPIYNTNSSLSSGSHSISIYFGLYSRNASTLSLVASASGSTAVTHSGTLGSYSLYSGVRNFTLGMTTTITAGDYWMGFGSRTSSGGADGSYSNMALNQGYFSDAVLSGTYGYAAAFGSSLNSTNQMILGQGYFSASTAGIPSSIAFSQINGTASNAGNMQAVAFASGTV